MTNKKSRCRMCQKYADFWFEYGTTDGGIEWKGTYCEDCFPKKLSHMAKIWRPM